MSFSAFNSASCFIFSISSFDKPEDDSILIVCCLFVCACARVLAQLIQHDASACCAVWAQRAGRTERRQNKDDDVGCEHVADVDGDVNSDATSQDVEGHVDDDYCDCRYRASADYEYASVL